MENTIEDYLSLKFNKNIESIDEYHERLVFSFDEKRVLKLIPKNSFKEDVDLYKYLFENYNNLPIAKIYSIGEIQIPLKLKLQREYMFILMEKLDIPRSLEYELEYLDILVDDIERHCDIFLGISLFSGIGYILTKNENVELKLKCIRDYINEKESSFADTFEDVLEVIETLYEKGIYWQDIHAGQFGINQKNQLVAFDLDSLKLTKPKNSFIKNKIKENKILNFNEFLILENNNLINQLSKEIKDGTYFVFKYIEKYPQKEDKEPYKPLSIDHSGNILLEIDGEIYSSKAKWVEGIQTPQNENIQNYPLTPELTQPPKGPGGYSMGDLWKQDEEFDELLNQNGGLKKTIKKIKRLYDIDYSHCKSPIDLYQSLKVDGFLSKN